MLFPTVTFAVFFVAAMPLVWLARSRPLLHRIAIIATGGVFYAWWNWRFLLLLCGVTVFNDRAASALRHPRLRTTALVAGITGNLVLLGVFKYYGFFVDSLRGALRPIGLEPPLPLLEIALPVGISFFTFEAIAYLIEVSRGVIDRAPLLDYAAHVCFFPKLVSGPITRPSEFLPQLRNSPPPDRIAAPEAFWLFARGLIKKVVVATYLAGAISDPVFAAPAQHSALEALLAIYGYTAQLYIDFSAYTDMAIAVALLLGFRLPENFKAPYRAHSVHDFWDRWHISLSRWIRDFFFVPLYRRSRVRGRAGTGVVVAVMVLVGLWHGAAWTFVVWGGIHGCALYVERRVRERRRRLRRSPRTGLAWRAVGVVVTFHVVAVAWVFFRAPSLTDAFAVFGRLASPGPAPLVTPLLLLALVAVFGSQWIPDGWAARARLAVARLAPAAQAATLAVVLLLVDGFAPAGVAPFIYFRF